MSFFLSGAFSQHRQEQHCSQGAPKPWEGWLVPHAASLPRNAVPAHPGTPKVSNSCRRWPEASSCATPGCIQLTGKYHWPCTLQGWISVLAWDQMSPGMTAACLSLMKFHASVRALFSHVILSILLIRSLLLGCDSQEGLLVSVFWLIGASGRRCAWWTRACPGLIHCSRSYWEVLKLHHRRDPLCVFSSGLWLIK